MPDGGEPVKIKVLNDIAEIEPAEWDACAGPGNPFVSHGFLRILEQSGSVSGRTGWLPQHLAIEDENGRLIGVVPCYLKSHSYGEYVFDWGWADAFERAGGKYYPKLQISVPFTPVAGPRLMVRPGAEQEQTRLMLAAGLMELAKNHEVSSFHITFCTEDEWKTLGEAGLLQRMGQQFHWHNRGYESFDEFLAGLSSRKRKSIRKERREANEGGMEIRALTGDALEERHMEAFYGFYLNTVDKKWSNAYLTQEFFLKLATELSDRVVLVAAFQGGRLVGGALNLLGGDTLYGRQLGRGTALPDALFRGLLLPRDRLRDRAWARPRRGGSAGPAQDPARLPAEPHLQRPLDPRAPLPRGGGGFRQPRARAAPPRDARADGSRPLPPDRQRPGLSLSP